MKVLRSPAGFCHNVQFISGRIMAQKTVYAYTEGVLEPLDREYFKNTLRFLPGVSGVGAIVKPVVEPPPQASLGFEVHFDSAKLTIEEISKRLKERGFKVAIQELDASTAVMSSTAAPVADVYSPVSPNGNKEVLFRVAGLVTVKEVREIRGNLSGTLGVRDFFSMVAEAADEPWAGDTGLVDVQFDASRTNEETIKALIERVHGLHVTSWKTLPSNLNFPWPL
jgi:copper chaperone CopZ